MVGSGRGGGRVEKCLEIERYLPRWENGNRQYSQAKNTHNAVPAIAGVTGWKTDTDNCDFMSYFILD